MLAENPVSLSRGRKMTREELSQALRYAIIAELDAINLYIQFASATDDEKARKIFLDVAREEKTHVGEFLELLLSLDPEQVKELEEGRKEVKELLESH
ncbi:MAG: ferritin family protein [Candidatus Korarchaeota archaeon]|nr:ferritin family protein [Candidatus Korarchaeota archaeon]